MGLSLKEARKPERFLYVRPLGESSRALYCLGRLSLPEDGTMVRFLAERRGAGCRDLALALSAVALLSAGAQGSVAAAPLSPEAWQPVDLVYQVHAGGLHVFTIDLRAALGAEGYDMDLALRTDGSLAWLLDWKLMSEVSGRPEAAAPVPARFRTESLWRGNQRWVELSYEGTGAPLVSAEPPPEEDDRDKVPVDLRLDTVDPLSAGVALIYALGGEAGCALSLGVFDGRRRFNARSRDDGEREIAVGEISPYGGLARACAVTVEPVTGFWRESRYEARKEDFTVFLRQVAPETPPLPVRVEAETRFGAVRIHLVEATLAEGGGCLAALLDSPDCS